MAVVVPRGDIDMSTEPAPVEEIATTTEPEPFASDERQQVIDSVAQLLSSGRLLSEILQSVKLRADRNEATNPDGAAESDTQTLRISDESRINRSNSEISHLPKPVERTGAHNEVRQCGAV